MILSRTAEKIALTMTRKLRVLSLQQIAEGWCSGNISNARMQAEALIKFGFLEQYDELVGPRLETDHPLFVWTPNDTSTPNFEKLAYQCKNRWGQEARKETLFFATRDANNALAGFNSGKSPPSFSVRHDLQVAQVFISHMENRGSEWKRWQGEDQLKFDGYCRGKTAIPDAAIRSRKQRYDDIVIEIGGQYAAKRLEEFHIDYQTCKYEIW